MAIGDVVNEVSADNTAITFRPAAGVEVMISWVANDEQTTQISLADDGTQFCDIGSTRAGTGQANNICNMKMFINNTFFLIVSAGGSTFDVGFTGIQIN